MSRFWKNIGILTLLCVVVLAIGYAIPERCAMPCGNVNSYNKGSFWTHPWTRGVNGAPHYGVDIFGKEGSLVVSQTGGIVIYAGWFNNTAGNMVCVLGPKWRIHEYMHLKDVTVTIGDWLSVDEQIGTLGKTGNAANTPPHTHYSILTPIPYLWLYNEDYGKKNVPKKFNWMKMFYLNPADHLPSK
jgi:murein DD-endopeptidase MepM/ murein hydrolase activator NlpD